MPKVVVDKPKFVTAGQETSTIPVRLSYRIIELFSEGLYASPNKAIEELVSNSFDAGASNVHVIITPDRSAKDSFIAVVDDGTGMNADDLRQHWLIGDSNKRNLAETPKGRKQIGKFGIGKLATFVLARYLTHICKRDGKFYATTMDYANIPKNGTPGIHTKQVVKIPLRELTAKQAQEALTMILSGTKPGYKAIELFGPNAVKNWTVAIMSGLKDMALEIQKGTLTWVLRTAMPLRDDFILYLDGERLRPWKESIGPVKKWVIGKDIKELATLDDFEVTEDAAEQPVHRYGLTHPILGRVTGYLEVYDKSLTEGKSDYISRSHGFFVYVRERLINEEDELFGLDALRHGTFSRFRAVIHIDKLDEDLRSTREAVRKGSNVKVAQSLLNALFNIARNWLKQYDESREAGERTTGRIAQSAGSLTRRPVIGLVRSALFDQVTPRYIAIPGDLSPEERSNFLDKLQKRAETDEGLITQIALEDLLPEQGLAVLDVNSGVLNLNNMHPFVAAHREDFERGRETLSLFAAAEIFTEAFLYELGLGEDVIREVTGKRDELFRQFARSMRRTADMVAQALIDASTNKDQLEKELVAAFDSMGFDTQPIGGKGKPDGKAVACLGALKGKERRYTISLEAKSKEQPGKKVTSKSVSISAIARQRDDYKCDHAIVVGPDFPTSQGEKAAVVKEARANNQHTGKTITLMRVHDLAKLVRVVTLNGIALDQLQELFKTCITPEESQAWVDKISQQHEKSKPAFERILKTIWELQEEQPSEAVQFQSITTALRRDKSNPLQISTEEIQHLCRALSMMTNWVVVRTQAVELRMRPDKVMRAAVETLSKFPEDEQKKSMFQTL